MGHQNSLQVGHTTTNQCWIDRMDRHITVILFLLLLLFAFHCWSCLCCCWCSSVAIVLLLLAAAVTATVAFCCLLLLILLLLLLSLLSCFIVFTCCCFWNHLGRANEVSTLCCNRLHPTLIWVFLAGFFPCLICHNSGTTSRLASGEITWEERMKCQPCFAIDYIWLWFESSWLDVTTENGATWWWGSLTC